MLREEERQCKKNKGLPRPLSVQKCRFFSPLPSLPLFLSLLRAPPYTATCLLFVRTDYRFPSSALSLFLSLSRSFFSRIIKGKTPTKSVFGQATKQEATVTRGFSLLWFARRAVDKDKCRKRKKITYYEQRRAHDLLLVKFLSRP